MNRRSSEITIVTTIDSLSETVTIKRTTPYIRGPTIIDTYTFDGKIDDIQLFPISHKIEILDAKGKFFRYEIRDLVYDGPTFKLSGQTSASFGRNMKVTWWKGYRLGWVYKSGSMYVKSEKLESDYEVFNVRLFDPIITGNQIGNKVVSEMCSPVYKTWTEEIPHYTTCLEEECTHNNSDIKVNSSYVVQPNGTFSFIHCFYNSIRCLDYIEKIVHTNEQVGCKLNGKINVSDTIYSGNDAYCRLEDPNICCYSNKEGGEFAATWRKDGSVEKECENLITDKVTLVSSTNERFMKKR